MSLTYDEIAEIIKLIDSSSCDELIVETGDIKLVVRRNGAAPGAAAEYVERGSAPVTVSPAAPQKVRGVAPKVGAVAGQIEVTAPMVGTFYRAPSPEASAFRRCRRRRRRRRPTLPDRSDEAVHDHQRRGCRSYRSNRCREWRTRRVRTHVVRHRAELAGNLQTIKMGRSVKCTSKQERD